MLLHLVKVAFLLTLLIIFTTPFTCQAQDELKPTLPKSLTGELQIPLSIADSLKTSISTTEIKHCIENTGKLENLQKERASRARLLDYYKDVLIGFKKQKETIKKRIDYFQNDCDFYGENCATVDYHKNKYLEELQEERKTKVEIAGAIREAVAVKREEENHRASFDIDCQKKNYDKMVVLKICRELYSYEFPICRDFM
jgi:hypothetical protein